MAPLLCWNPWGSSNAERKSKSISERCEHRQLAWVEPDLPLRQGQSVTAINCGDVLHGTLRIISGIKVLHYPRTRPP